VETGHRLCRPPPPGLRDVNAPGMARRFALTLKGAHAGSVLAIVDKPYRAVAILNMPLPATTTRQRRSKVRSGRHRPAGDSSIDGFDFNDAGADLPVINAVALGEALSGDINGAIGGSWRAHDKRTTAGRRGRVASRPPVQKTNAVREHRVRILR
jgi:hypothetical protein